MRLPTTNWFKGELLKATLGLQDYIPVPTQLGIGTGGAIDSLHPIPPDPNDVGLAHEVYRKPISHKKMGEGLIGIIEASVTGGEISNVVINEAGIFDQNGSLIGRVTFLGKGLGELSTLKFIFELVI